MENSVFTYKLCERIDSDNSEQVKQELEKAISEAEYTELVLDASDLKYISSAGLRVILAQKKKNENLQVINVCRDVYDIFEMTGFKEIIDIKRAFREFSIDGLEMIGGGACGKVYRLDADTIIKVFHPGFPFRAIETEQKRAQMAFLNGIDTAISYDVVKVGESYGIVFELLNADTIGNLIRKEPDKADYYIRIYADFLKKLHSIRFSDDSLPKEKDITIQRVDRMGKIFDDLQKAKIKRFFESMPDRDTFIHGDYNVGNVMYSNGKPILIDLGESATGHPVFDLMGVHLTLKLLPQFLSGDDEMTSMGFSKKTSEYLWLAFCKRYFETDDEDKINVIENEIAPFSAIRVIQAASLNLFTDEELQACKSLLLKAAENDGEKHFSF